MPLPVKETKRNTGAETTVPPPVAATSRVQMEILLELNDLDELQQLKGMRRAFDNLYYEGLENKYLELVLFQQICNLLDGIQCLMDEKRKPEEKTKRDNRGFFKQLKLPRQFSGSSEQYADWE
jgi:hypothetical protein